MRFYTLLIKANFCNNIRNSFDIFLRFSKMVWGNNNNSIKRSKFFLQIFVIIINIFSSQSMMRQNYNFKNLTFIRFLSYATSKHTSNEKREKKFFHILANIKSSSFIILHHTTPFKNIKLT